MFTGEMVFPCLFEHMAALRPYKAAADLLAARQDWPELYDVQALRANSVPAAAATYYEVRGSAAWLGRAGLGWLAGWPGWLLVLAAPGVHVARAACQLPAGASCAAGPRRAAIRQGAQLLGTRQQQSPAQPSRAAPTLLPL
jgi:hypothetical protein